MREKRGTYKKRGGGIVVLDLSTHPSTYTDAGAPHPLNDPALKPSHPPIRIHVPHTYRSRLPMPRSLIEQKPLTSVVGISWKGDGSAMLPNRGPAGLSGGRGEGGGEGGTRGGLGKVPSAPHARVEEEARGRRYPPRVPLVAIQAPGAHATRWDGETEGQGEYTREWAPYAGVAGRGGGEGRRANRRRRRRDRRIAPQRRVRHLLHTFSSSFFFLVCAHGLVCVFPLTYDSMNGCC